MARLRLCLGVDIGASSINVGQLKRTNQGFVVDLFAAAPLSQETIVDGALMNASQVVETLARLLREHKVKNRRAALAISGNSVIIKKIPLPMMTQDELNTSIYYEAGQFIPFAIEDVYLDVQILGPSTETPGQMDVILVAAKKDVVGDYVAVMTEAGLEPIICDVDTFAIENAFLASHDPMTQDIALINIGASKTNINVMAAGTSAFTRDIALGGNTYTEEIQRTFKVSFDEAEKLKIYAGQEHKLANAQIPEVDRALDEVTQTLVSEIQHSLDFYSATRSHARLTGLYLSGGGARMRRLVEALKKQLGVSVEVVNPFAKMAPGAISHEALEAVGPGAAVAVGLALRALGDG